MKNPSTARQLSSNERGTDYPTVAISFLHTCTCVRLCQLALSWPRLLGLGRAPQNMWLAHSPSLRCLIPGERCQMTSLPLKVTLQSTRRERFEFSVLKSLKHSLKSKFFLKIKILVSRLNENVYIVGKLGLGLGYRPDTC